MLTIKPIHSFVSSVFGVFASIVLSPVVWNHTALSFENQSCKQMASAKHSRIFPPIFTGSFELFYLLLSLKVLGDFLRLGELCPPRLQENCQNGVENIALSTSAPCPGRLAFTGFYSTVCGLWNGVHQFSKYSAFSGVQFIRLLLEGALHPTPVFVPKE